MELSWFSIITLVALALFSCRAQCESVFVLETSDSSQPIVGDTKPAKQTSIAQKIPGDSNTHIITDDEQKSQNSNKLKQDSQPYKKNQDSQDNNKDQRRSAEDSNLRNRNPVTRNTQQISQPANQPRTRSTTSASVYERERNRDQDHDHPTPSHAPKNEERLLISITSDDDDYKPVIKPSSNAGYSEEVSPSPSGNQKRKPSFTISIQNPDGNKVSGGTPSVIVRPTENGQAILISTVNDNKHTGINTHHKPGNHNDQSPHREPSGSINGHHNDQSPYREPDAPLNGHHISSTTYRPQPINGDYSSRPVYNGLGSSSMRPIVSTLLDPPTRPISSSNEEIPSRPPLSSIPGISGSQPIRPPIQDSEGPSWTGSQPDLDRPTQTEAKFPLNEKNCGQMQETRIVGGEEANPDDFLWMAAIIPSKVTAGEAKPFCGGALITRRHILTAAHCLENLAPRDVLVRLGSYDFDDATASSTSADYAIDQFRVPANYTKKTHVADIAIMRLKTPLSPTDTFKTVCMPQPRRSYVGALGTVTGYGSHSQTFRKASPKLRQVTVPIWENRKCSTYYKKNMTDSFLCAGYEEGGKDACQGDSGGPLMTEGPEEKMMVVGVVSHGIGCGAPGYPGVYTRTTTFLEWIEKNTRE